jgi:hypothetical protein
MEQKLASGTIGGSMDTPPKKSLRSFYGSRRVKTAWYNSPSLNRHGCEASGGFHQPNRSIHQFVKLWNMVQQFHLSDRPDEIMWRFTASGKYSSQSAYQIQFTGSFMDHDWGNLWRAKVENKCKMFWWLILQNKLWTADRVIKHGGQGNQIYVSCAEHIGSR